MKIFKKLIKHLKHNLTSYLFLLIRIIFIFLDFDSKD